MYKVLMIGPSKNEKGGISTVINNFEKCPYFKTFFVDNWQSKGWLLLFLKNIMKIRNLIKKNEIDIVHFHVAQNGSFFRKSILLFLIPKQVPTIFHMHASQFDHFYSNARGLKRFWIDTTLKKVNSIVAVSDQWKRYYESITKTPVAYINNSVSVQEKSLFCYESKRIITLGRIGKRKGSYDILDIAKEILKIDSDITFDLYGDGDLKEIRFLARDLPNVTVHSWIPSTEFENVLKKTTLHLLPSYSEGLPMAVLETMALGIPNITSDVGGLPSVIIPDYTGWLVKAGDLSQITNRILYAVNHSKELNMISKNSKKIIRENFSLQKYFQFWDEYYCKELYK